MRDSATKITPTNVHTRARLPSGVKCRKVFRAHGRVGVTRIPRGTGACRAN